MTSAAPPPLDPKTLRSTPPCATGKDIIARHTQMNVEFDRSFFKDHLLAHALGSLWNTASVTALRRNPLPQVLSRSRGDRNEVDH